MQAAPSSPILVLSPHLDDGVFACGRLLASVPASTVATLFAGLAPPGLAPTEWDRAAGFASAADAVPARREEDRRALAILGAQPRWLPLADSQYAAPPACEEVSRWIESLLPAYPQAPVFFPLGLFHADHRLASEAALRVLARQPQRCWVAYEDALYRRIPGLVAERLGALRRAGWQPRPLRFAEAAGAARSKSRAVACYGSQLRALATPGRPGHADLADDEGYWEMRLAPRRPALQGPRARSSA